MSPSVGIVLLVCIWKVCPKPVFKINGRTIIEPEIWVTEDSFPIPDTVALTTVYEHLSFFWSPFLSRLLLLNRKCKRNIVVIDSGGGGNLAHLSSFLRGGGRGRRSRGVLLL
jgi:hypothetical protein